MIMQNRRDTQQPKKNFIRMNMNIRVPSVRVIKDGEQLGIMPTRDALRLAQEDGRDLIEIVPNANPPVCHIMDYGQWKYEEGRKVKDQARRQRETMIEIKEVRFRPVTNMHDIDTKIKSIRKFIEDGDKVQISLEFKKREIAHKEEGYAVIEKVLSLITEFASVELAPKMEGKKLMCRLAPKPKEKA
jgi:translation initiation factor IF-3